MSVFKAKANIAQISCDVRLWPLADSPAVSLRVRYWG
jgi:hypothetical protein